MSDNGAGHRPRLGDDEELANVDDRGKHTTQQHHEPAGARHRSPVREDVDERDDVKEEEGGDRGLVGEQLHGRHVELAMITADPDGVERRGGNAGKSEEDAERGGGGD